MKKTLFFIFLISLVYNTIGQVTPRYLNYEAPKTGSGTVYQHPRPSYNSSSTYYSSPTMTSKDPYCLLGRTTFDVYKKLNGDLKYLGIDDEGRKEYSTSDLSEDKDVTFKYYYYFLNDKLVEFQIYLVGKNSTYLTREKVRGAYNSLKDSYYENTIPITTLKVPNSESFILVYSYFNVFFIDGVNEDEPCFLIYYKYR